MANAAQQLSAEQPIPAMTELINTCAMAPGFQPAQRLTCYAIAGIYFIGVRLFGASSYQGSGSPA